MSAYRIATVAAAALIVAASLAGGVWLRQMADAPGSAREAATHFALTDHNGQPVTEANYRGRWLLVFFGFIRCPDICPTSMSYAADLLQILGDSAPNVQIAFVTVDPERDTPEALRDYLKNFDTRIVGLTGTPEQIAVVTKSFGVHYAKRALEGLDDYTMDHSTAFYLVDTEGRLRRAFALNGDGDKLTADLLAAMAAPAASKE